jgi:hypothetical protein
VYKRQVEKLNTAPTVTATYKFQLARPASNCRLLKPTLLQ